MVRLLGGRIDHPEFHPVDVVRHDARRIRPMTIVVMRTSAEHGHRLVRTVEHGLDKQILKRFALDHEPFVRAQKIRPRIRITIRPLGALERVVEHFPHFRRRRKLRRMHAVDTVQLRNVGEIPLMREAGTVIRTAEPCIEHRRHVLLLQELVKNGCCHGRADAYHPPKLRRTNVLLFLTSFG